MIIARDSSGKARCARCGRYVKLTKDHFIPKCSRMNVDKPGNLVGICEKCNRKKETGLYCRSGIFILTVNSGAVCTGICDTAEAIFLNSVRMRRYGKLLRNCKKS